MVASSANTTNTIPRNNLTAAKNIISQARVKTKFWGAKPVALCQAPVPSSRTEYRAYKHHLPSGESDHSARIVEEENIAEFLS